MWKYSVSSPNNASEIGLSHFSFIKTQLYTKTRGQMFFLNTAIAESAVETYYHKRLVAAK